MICEDLFYTMSGVMVFHNRKCEVMMNQQSDPKTPSRCDYTSTDGMTTCRSVGVWIWNIHIRFGLRTAELSHLVHPCRSEWRILTLTQQVWTDSAVTAQCYFIPVRQGSESTSEQCSCTTEKQEVGGKYMWRFFSYSAVITAVERSSSVQVCVRVRV